MRTWNQLIRDVHASPSRFVIAVTGGGSVAVSRLLSVPGASRTLLEAVVPYSSRSLADWLKREPEQYCSRKTALAMATVAWRRAVALTGTENDGNETATVVGVGCTASLASDRPKRGSHRCWIATHSSRETRLHALTLAKGARGRVEEEEVVGQCVLRALAEASGIEKLVDVDLLEDETIVVEHQIAPPLVTQLAIGRIPLIWSLPDGSLAERIESAPVGILSGAFDPLHDGHRQLRDAAERRLGGPVFFELTISNADKPPLDFLTIEHRRRQIDTHPVALSAAGTFVEKSAVLPRVTFVVGIDTAERLLEGRFYGGPNTEIPALRRIQGCGCRFLVAGRKQDGSFRTLTELKIPAGLRDIFDELPESAFRADISSTDLRAEQPG